MSPKIFNNLLVLVLVMALSACNIQNEIPELDEGYSELPSGERMHYLYSGNPAGKTIVFLHGYPTSNLLYRNLMTRVCDDPEGDYYCLAVSQIGFGKSSCPGDGASVGPLYEVEQLEQFVLAMDIYDAAIVVHDWGGPIGTTVSLRHQDRFSHLIVLNTLLSFPEINLLEGVMGMTQQFFDKPRPVVEAIYPGFVAQVMQLMTNRYLSKEVLALYKQPFQTNQYPLARCRTHAGINLFAKGHTDKALFDELKNLSELYWQNKPTLFLWSTDDLLLGARSAIGRYAHKKMNELFPQAKTTLIKDANHFLQEDQPDKISNEIVRFLKNIE